MAASGESYAMSQPRTADQNAASRDASAESRVTIFREPTGSAISGPFRFARVFAGRVWSGPSAPATGIAYGRPTPRAVVHSRYHSSWVRSGARVTVSPHAAMR